MMKDQNKLLEAHEFCTRHRDQISNGELICGCFHCEKIFYAKDLEIWVDDDQTALCPFCGIDSVICESSGYTIDKTFLKEMNKRWFSPRRPIL